MDSELLMGVDGKEYRSKRTDSTWTDGWRGLERRRCGILEDFFVVFQPRLDLGKKLVQTKSNPQDVLT
jgi:hypothetical protein